MKTTTIIIRTIAPNPFDETILQPFDVHLDKVSRKATAVYDGDTDEEYPDLDALAEDHTWQGPWGIVRTTDRGSDYDLALDEIAVGEDLSIEALPHA